MNLSLPVVINYYQRGAPSTGLPTRHGQDDLRFVILSWNVDTSSFHGCSVKEFY
ncbi:MAG: hypothetical protein ACNA7I_02035 [Candidatus Methanoperedens sp.]